MAHQLEGNKAIAYRFAEEWNKGNLEGAVALMDENIVDHNPGPGQAPGKAGAKQSLAAFFTAFPDLKITNDFVLADDDRVVDHGTARGTHKGNLFGIPATNKPVEITYTDIYRIANGKIAELWHIEDVPAIMVQIGAMPAPGSSK